MPVTPDPFTGAYEPVKEEVTAYDLPVTGTIPDGLDGRYLRNGPNPLAPGAPGAHFFAGTAMVHGVRLRGGRAKWYRNRWIRSAAVAETLGERPRPGAAVRIADVGPNTHAIGHADRTLALVEGGFRPYELSYEIETVGATDFGGTLPDGFAAHSKLDPATGELHTITWQRAGCDRLRHVVVSPYGKVVRTVDIPAAHMPVVHDMALTPHYVIVYDLSVTVDPVADVARKPFPVMWNEARGARVGLLPRNGTEVRWFDVGPCFVFHTLNAYEDGDRVVVDVVRYPRMFLDGALNSPSAPTLDRWEFDTRTGATTETRLDDRPQEFPAVSPAVVGRAHRYGYSAVASALLRSLGPSDALDGAPPTASGDALLKHDLSRRSTEVRAFGDGHYTGEAAFVPTADARSEDDGHLLVLVFDPGRGATDLVVLSAEDFTGPPVATVHLPVRVPAGFHGSWIPDPG
ncbi:carotenoid oxygenase family protein [Streptomyces sp. NPDC059096]|uniref:carotenoid oxygenase family protein n=1 Tax=Streptomyces sp. NPDC059096 TaxID=3346727 RepID=UPI0036BF1906